MNINLNIEVNFKDPQIQQFLYDRNQSNIKIDPATPQGFSNDLNDRRGNTFFPGYKTKIPFLVIEEWAVEEIILDDSGNQEGTIQSGLNLIEVVMGCEIEINLEYCLFLKHGISQESIDYARFLFNEFDPKRDGLDLDAWIKKYLNDSLNEDMFSIEASTLIDKLSDKLEINIDQRLALLTLFGQANTQTSGQILIVDRDGADYYRWSESKNMKIRKVDEYLKPQQGSPPINRDIREVQNPSQIQATLNSALDEITSILVPVECGRMRREEIKLLQLASWPEFKIDWVRVLIKVGCSRITISIPVLRVRISTLHFYVYFSLPVHLDRFVFKIAETCAIRSALGAGIIGIIMSNPAAAIASFNALFKRCLEQEIKNCINSGLFTLKQTGNWT